jgi:hypothetical protein
MLTTDGKWYDIRRNGLLDAEAFHHIVATYDGHMMRLFFDGVPVDTCRTSGLAAGAEKVMLSGGAYPFHGLLDEVQIYKHALNAREIEELYAGGADLPAGMAGPVAWWHLDETSGAMARDSVGSNHMTVHGATWTPGKFGGALHFASQEVKSLSDSRVRGGETSEILQSAGGAETKSPPADSGAQVVAPANGIEDLQKFTLALWVKLNAMPPLSIQRFLTLMGEKAVLRYDGSAGPQQLQFYMKMSGDDNWGSIHVDGLLSVGAFHHIVGTFDGGTMRLFFDGVPVGSCETTGRSIRGGCVELGSPSDILYGDLDEVQIYDRALDANEIQELYSSDGITMPAGLTGPLAWWHLDEMSGTVAYDCVGSNHTTYIHGATWTPGKASGALHFAPQEIRSLSDPNVRGDETAEAGQARDSQKAAPPQSDAGVWVDGPGNGIDDLQKFSMVLWVKLNAVPPDRIQRFITLQGEKAVLRYDGADGLKQLHFYMRMTDDTWSNICVDGIFDTEAYHHVAGTYDSHTMRLFFDGVQVGRCETTGLSIRGQGVGLGSGGEPLCGELDEVQIYDRALEAREIQELYSDDDATLPAGMASPIAWWHFDETSGTTAHDSVGSNHGTVHGATWTPGKVKGALHFGTLNPANGSDIGRLPTVPLRWASVPEAVAYRVYFGPDPQSLVLLDEVRSGNTVSSPELEARRWYCWRVDAIQSDGSAREGALWSFSTGDMVGWWQFDDMESRVATDSSGRGHHGTMAGNPQWQPGHVGGALAFDGIHDYVTIKDVPEFDIRAQITVSCWIKVAEFDKPWQAIIAKGNFAWRVIRDRNTRSIDFACTGVQVPDTVWGNVLGRTPVDDGRWHHLAGVYDGTYVRLYVDGALDASVEGSGTLNATEDDVLIGANAGDDWRHWRGLVDDVRVYSYALSEEEVKGLCAGTGPTAIARPAWLERK